MRHAKHNDVFESPRFPDLVLEHVRYSMTGKKVDSPWFYGTSKSDDDLVLVGKTQRQVENQYQAMLDRRHKRKNVDFS